MNKFAMFCDLLATLWGWLCVYFREGFQKVVATFVK